MSMLPESVKATLPEKVFTEAGEMGAKIRSREWSSTNLGSIENWPASLRTAVGFCLTSGLPAILWWGWTPIAIYNDACLPILGAEKYAQGLGKPGSEVVPEIWTQISPQLEEAFYLGKAISCNDIKLSIERDGNLQIGYFTFTVTPIWDETGKVGGVLTTITETTKQVLSSQRWQTLHNLAAIEEASSVEEMSAIASRTLAENSAEILFSLIYLISADGDRASLIAANTGKKESEDNGLVEECNLSSNDLHLLGFPNEILVKADFCQQDKHKCQMLAEVARTGKSLLCEIESKDSNFNHLIEFDKLKFEPSKISLLLLPIAIGNKYQNTGILVAAIDPFFSSDPEVRSFLELAARQIAIAIANAPTDRKDSIIEDRQSAEDRQEENFRLVVEKSPDIIARFDRKYRHLYVNPAVEKASVISAKEYIGKTNRELGMPSDICSFWEENLRHVFVTGKEHSLEFNFPNSGGKYYQSRLVPEFAKDGSIVSVLSITRDITQLRKIEEALRESNQRMDSLIQASPLAIIALDVEGKIKMWSPAAERIFGWSEKEVLDRFPPFFPTDKQQDFSELHEIKLQGKLVAGIELKCQKKSGKEIDIALWGAAMHDAKGELSGTMAVIADISTRKKAESEREKLIKLLQSEQALLEAVLQQMPAAAVIAEAPSGKLVLGNKLVEKIWRQPFLESNSIEQYQNYQGFHIDGNLYQPEEWPLARSIRNGEVITEEEINFVRGDGSFGTMRVSSTPIYNYEGEIVAGVMTFYDITDRKRAKQALQESEEKFRTLVHSMQDIVFTLDCQQRHTDVFGTWWEITGVKPDYFLGKTAREILGDEAAAIHEEANKKALAGEMVVYEWSFDSSIGMQYCQTSLSPLQDAKGNFIGVVGVGRDITKLHKAEEAQRFLAEASKELTTTLDYETTLQSVARLAVPYLGDFCIIFALEDQGQIRRVAVAHTEPTKELLLLELQKYSVDPNSQTPVAQVLRTGESLLVQEVSIAILEAIHYEVEHYHIFRELDPKSFVLVPLIARGRTLGAIAFTFSESGRRHEESDLNLAKDLAYRAALAFDNARLYRKAQEANRIKDEFLAIVSHELRTPLNSILGWATMLRTRKFDETIITRALETIERNARSQSQLIEDLLDVSRMLRGKLTLNFHPVDLVSLIEASTEALRPIAQTNNIEVELILPDSGYLVYGDFNRLQQILWNLLSNAIKFTPSGGQVKVSLSQVIGDGKETRFVAAESLSIPESIPEKFVKNQVSPPISKYAQIQVSDSGKGISSDFLPYVFDRFRQADSTTTRSYGGLGLGLAIVRHLVELHKGNVCAASDGEEKGATFMVYLPLLNSAEYRVMNDESASSHSSIITQNSSLSSVKVLVVDDDEDTRNFLTTVLQQYAAEVKAASSANEALEALTEWKPDVLISDIGMPGEDGYTLIRKVRAMQVMLPAVALTAYAMESDREKALDAGFNKHLSKPIEPDNLVAVVAELARNKK